MLANKQSLNKAASSNSYLRRLFLSETTRNLYVSSGTSETTDNRVPNSLVCFSGGRQESWLNRKYHGTKKINCVNSECLPVG